MLRRILVFLALLFLVFFVWRYFDKAATDDFLYKVQNFSFSSSEKQTYTTKLVDGSGNVYEIETTDKTLGREGLEQLLKDTLRDKNGTDADQTLIDEILSQENLADSQDQHNKEDSQENGEDGEISSSGSGTSQDDTADGEISENENASSSESEAPEQKGLSDKDIQEAEKVLKLFH